ncbi:UPSTREAM OF FLC protein [Perilla frutescens var. hirtella]|nr:UPSTREAM OF FLC protein [Perilla frutescens var. hirtella]KAH6810464.1 UPSTREAM OF FLC protein [Perilla frutescens var. frutescens]
MAVSAGSTSGRMTELQLTKLWRDQHRETSPDRTKVWTEPPNGKSKSDRRVPVVYYLSRNGQLEHPHFMEVPLSSPQGLFLRDVIGRLNVLRGKGMATMYSWSCKRSYKNGFVWHDLSENDFIYPAHGHEYVLKGSEILDNTFVEMVQRPPPRENEIAAADAGLGYPRPSDRRRRNQSCSSIEYDQNEYSVYKAEPSCRSYAADASTQTDDGRRRRRRPPTEIVEEKKSKEIQRDEIEISPPPSDSSPETLETLLKADGRLILHPETVNKESTSQQQIQRATKSSSVLMQLISCGSLSFKDCGAGQVISQYRMRVPRGGGGRVKLEEKEYFSGSIVETKKEELPRLKRCSSYNADR